MGFMFYILFLFLVYSKQKIIGVFLFFLINGTLLAQEPNGTPFIRYYSPHEYQQATENWAVLQDKKGIMYFGNLGGVLQYHQDNSNRNNAGAWTIIPVTNTSVVRSLAINDKGVIYVGAVGEIGYLLPNEKGKMQYHSLLGLLPETERDFTDVWKTYVIDDAVYFQTFSKLIRIKNNQVKIWKPKSSFHFSFYVGGEFYINERGQGLQRLVNDSLVLVQGAEFFKDLRIYAMLPYGYKKILVATREKGLVLYNQKSYETKPFTEWNIQANTNLIEAQIYGACVLKGNTFAFATLQNGIFILNKEGQIIQQINKTTGLRDNAVKYVFIDVQNDLWAALGNGIAHVEMSSPLSTLGDMQGLHGFVQDITKYKNKLYVATSLGLFYSEDNQFYPIKEINSQTWVLKKNILGKDTLLLAATEAGVYEVNKTHAKIIREGFAYTLYQSQQNPERVFIGNPDGISSIKYKNHTWIDEDYLNGVDDEIRSITEDTKHNLWLGTPFNGVLKVDFNLQHNSKETQETSWAEKYRVQHYDTANGLPDMVYNIPCKLNNNIVFATSNGVFAFDEKKDTFYPVDFLKEKLKNIQVFRLVQQDKNKVWLFTFNNVDKTKISGVANLQKSGGYDFYTQPFLKINEREIHAIYPDSQITWLGGPDGLLRYDSEKKKDFSIPFYAVINGVSIDKDSIIYFGNNISTSQIAATQNISYTYNSFVFEYSATCYGKEEKNVYNIYLEGHDQSWLGWDKKTSKEYTDLKEGDYIFHVKAKNIYGVESIESTYSFTVSPPWYRTVWAYIAYVLAVIGLVYAIIRISVRRLVKAKNHLEALVTERTAEVVAQKHLIEEKHKEITDSINYAERIQRSFLATEEMLDNNLKDYFVFFKPKDVVSGDFYWGASIPLYKEGAGGVLFCLATADSTGHGVPGAIMSLLNITSLEKAIEKHTLPHDILNFARTEIINRLKKDGSAEGGKDGMDCSLCVYDFSNMKLFVAAANNPVWIVRASASSATNEIIEIKPDKMPVGKHDRQDIPFTLHEIDLQKGDVVYTLTDGFPDQFGGDNNKKFMIKKLRELIVANAHLPMHEQKQLLETTFANWVGNLEQVDDVTVIGVRI